MIKLFLIWIRTLLPFFLGGTHTHTRTHAHTHTQPEELTEVLEISNVVFTSMFALEMVLKLLAFGPFGYIRSQYNIFDSIIVIIRSVVLGEHHKLILSFTLSFKGSR